jgi:hypothetical protein
MLSTVIVITTATTPSVNAVSLLRSICDSRNVPERGFPFHVTTLCTLQIEVPQRIVVKLGIDLPAIGKVRGRPVPVQTDAWHDPTPQYWNDDFRHQGLMCPSGTA